MAVVDLDGDGYTEIISAGYTAGTVYVHTYAPEAQMEISKGYFERRKGHIISNIQSVKMFPCSPQFNV